jgi:hypothetical protein
MATNEYLELQKKHNDLKEDIRQILKDHHLKDIEKCLKIYDLVRT